MKQERIDEVIESVIERSNKYEPGSKEFLATTNSLKVLKEMKQTEVSNRQLDIEEAKLDSDAEIERERLEVEKRAAKFRLIGDILKVVGTVAGGILGLVGLREVISAEDDDDKILPSSRTNWARNLFPRS